MRRPTAASRAGLLLPVGLIFLAGCGPFDQPAANLHVKVLYTMYGIGDRSFADRLYEGLVRAGLELDFTTEEETPADLTAAEAIFRSWTQTPPSGTELIITLGQPYSAFIKGMGCEVGARKVLHLDDSLPACPNLKSVTYRTFAPSFLAGVAAATIGPRKTAAALGGMDLFVINEFIDGFAAGVDHAGAKMVAVEYLSESEDGFNNPQKAKETSTRLFESADVVFPVAGASGAGVIEAAKELEARYTVGVDADQSYLGRGVVIASVVKLIDQTVHDTILDVANNRFTGGQFFVGMEEDYTGLLINDVFSDRLHQAIQTARAAAIAAEQQYFKEGL